VDLGGLWIDKGLGHFRFSIFDFRMGEMGSFCRNGGAGGVGVRGSGFGVREEYPGGRAWGEAGVEGGTAKLDEAVSM